jgi:hypothetical protein
MSSLANTMPVTEATPFACPNCGAQYKLVRVETNETLPDVSQVRGTASWSRRQFRSEILLGGSSRSKGSWAAVVARPSVSL